MGTGLLVKGYLHKTPIYEKGDWCTEVFIGDRLLVDSGGFGSEFLEYAKIYEVIDDNGLTKLKSEDGTIIDERHTKNTMPFFVKLLHPAPNDR